MFFVFILIVLVFFLALNLSVLSLVLFLVLTRLGFIYFILVLKPLLISGVNICPHITNDFCDLSNFGSWIVGLNTIIDFSSIKEKSWESSFRSWWLYYELLLLFMTFPFYPLYNKFNTKPLLFIYIYKGPFYLYIEFPKLKIWLD